MNKIILVFFISGALLSGCSESSKRKNTEVPCESVPDTTVARSVRFTTSDVVTVASQLLLKKGLKWGNPVEVRWQSEYGRYLAIYPTPEKERLMVGDRGVFVWTNGFAAVMPQL